VDEALRRALGPLAAALGSRRLGGGLVLAAALAVAGVALAALLWLREGPWVPLFASLSAEDAGAIVTQLRAAKVPYRVGPGGTEILVPADQVHELRLRLAMQGLPLGGGVGFELFDRSSLGASDFAQRLNYQRALQGELARTIAQLRGITRARVHLAVGPPSLFEERPRAAAASVVLTLARGASLTTDQVRGIVHLVAASVEGLTPERVTVMDTAGRVLAVGSGDPAGVLSPRQLEAKAAVEETLERRVQSLLDSVLGPGQAVTRVSAQVTLQQVERTEERFDPNPVPRQETRTVEASRGRSSTPTGPGQATPPGTPPPASTTDNDTSRETESVTYELSRTVARTLIAPGQIQRLSVAVLLNTPFRSVPGPKGEETRQPAPRPAEELEKIRRVVMSAVGYDQARGDEVTVLELPFDSPVATPGLPAVEAGPPGHGAERRGLELALGGLVALLALAALAWVLLRRARQRTLAEVAAALGRPDAAPAAEAPAAPADPRLAEELGRVGRERDELRQKALQLASGEPEAAAQLIRAWLVKRPVQASAGGAHGG
jgi:flagellar M-ring protein FliF